MSGILSSTNRAELVRDLDGSSFDVVVIGGGVTGCGVALDAAQRGLSVLLVEAVDLAAGTSSKSTKLIHGGLRYLEQRDFPLVREALTERGRMVATLCPHLVKPLPFLFPLVKGVVERGYVGAGVAIYDGLAVTGGDKLPRHAHLGRRAAIERFPSLRSDMLTGAIQYWDAQVDDARHTLMVARSAASLGAKILTGTRVVGLRRSPTGAVSGAQLEVSSDEVSSGSGVQMVDVASRVVINATGAWSGQTEQLAGRTSLSVATSKGVHLVVPAERITGTVALITKTSMSVLFVIPFGHNWLIGTTDTPYSGNVDDPQADSDDVDYLLTEANRWLTSDLSRNDIIGVFAGLRPLIADNRASATTTLSREHLTTRPFPGLVSIAGGKYTTYRVMAADAVDAATADLGTIRGSGTAELPLWGADGYEDAKAGAGEWSRRLGVSIDQVHRLLGRYGGAITEVAEVIAQDPSRVTMLAGASPYLEAEIVVGARFEGARTLDDVLRRRTRIAFDSQDRGRSATPRVAQLLAAELGWDPGRQASETDQWFQAIDRELLLEAL